MIFNLFIAYHWINVMKGYSILRTSKAYDNFHVQYCISHTINALMCHQQYNTIFYMGHFNSNFTHLLSYWERSGYATPHYGGRHIPLACKLFAASNKFSTYGDMHRIDLYTNAIFASTHKSLCVFTVFENAFFPIKICISSIFNSIFRTKNQFWKLTNIWKIHRLISNASKPFS